MQSKTMSWIECGVTTVATGSVAALANYFLLPVLWTLPPTPWGAVTMSVFFGGLSLVVKYPIRRGFNAVRR
jgi:hypothetical protein